MLPPIRASGASDGSGAAIEQVAMHSQERASRVSGESVVPFTIACAALIALAATLAGWMPIGFSIATVFLFAGPHNWMEARYFLSQMPARWGPLRAFFLTGILGVLVLTLFFAALPHLGRAGRWTSAHWDIASATWNSAMFAWIALLVMLRSRQNPRRDWGWISPILFTLIACVWLWPQPWELAMVYLHPLVALWFLDRVIARRRPAWQRGYRAILLLIPLALVILWIRLADAPAFVGQDMLTLRITQQAGAGLLQTLSPHALVATHTFLETLHYGVWIVAVPLIAMRGRALDLTAIPLARRATAWRWGVGGVLGIGAVVVFALWASFISDYSMTRDIYFTIAIAHVLMEIPFLLRTL